MPFRRTLVLLAGAALLTASGSAATTQTPAVHPTATFRTARIAVLAANGEQAAIAPAKRHPCAAIVVWNEATRRTSGFHLGPNGCAGDGVRELALGGGQVAWIEAGGGNDLELSVNVAQLRPGGRKTQLDFQTNGDRAGGDPTGGWAGHLVGGGSVLAYNRWHVTCSRPDPFSCGEHDPQLRFRDERLLRLASGRATTVVTGSSSYALVAAAGGRVAVQRTDGIATFTAGGTPLAFVADSARVTKGVGLNASALVLLRSVTLDLFDPVSGNLKRSIALGTSGPSLAGLLGVTKTYALLRGPRALVLMRLSDGARATLALPLLAQRGLAGVCLTDTGLFYAYNLRSGTAPGRVAFVPTRLLASAF